MSAICQQVMQNLKDKNQGYSPILSCLEALNLKESSSQKGRVFTLLVPSSFYKDRIEKKLIASFEKELFTLLSGEPFEINIIISKQRKKRDLVPSPPQKQEVFIQKKNFSFQPFLYF